VRIPPAAHTYQSDVETVHRLEEDEFFDLENFSSRGEFLAKTHTYQLYFNLVRRNSHKENQSPWQIIERLAPRSPLELCLLPPVLLDYYLNDLGGYAMCPGIPINGKKYFSVSSLAPSYLTFLVLEHGVPIVRTPLQ
jgi:hypothetical protein